MAEGWKRLEGDLCSWLRQFERPGLEFRGPNQALPGLPFDGFRSDGCLTDGRTLIAIEVECTQMNPDTNVGKYWLLQTRHAYQRIVLFHIYTPDFNSYPWRMELGKFYVGKMSAEVPIEYLLLDERRASDYVATLVRLKKLIGERLETEFGLKNAVWEGREPL